MIGDKIRLRRHLVGLLIIIILSLHLQEARAGDCRVEQLSFHSAARGKDTAYFAFLPGSGRTGTFPVLYLLHGGWDDYRAWPDHAGRQLCDLADRHGLIIVTPDGDPFGWYADSPFDPANQIETFFMKELLPHVRENLPAAAGRRSITGLSMGGHGAFVLALRNPGTFASVSSMSGVMDITRHPDSWELARVFGAFKENRRLWQAHSATRLLCSDVLPAASDRRLKYLGSLPMLITVSSSDKYVLTDNRVFMEKLRSLKINPPPKYEESPGEHDWDYWLEQLPGHVRFQRSVLHGPVR